VRNIARNKVLIHAYSKTSVSRLSHTRRLRTDSVSGKHRWRHLQHFAGWLSFRGHPHRFRFQPQAVLLATRKFIFTYIIRHQKYPKNILLVFWSINFVC